MDGDSRCSISSAWAPVISWRGLARWKGKRMSLQVRPPEDCIIQLSDGDWILVKKWLTAGEANKVFSRMVKHMRSGEPNAQGESRPDIDYDIEQMGGLSQAVAYLLDWSAKGPDGKPLVIRDQSPRVIEEMLLALPQDAYKDITDAIGEHVKKMEAERVARKNAPASESGSPAISPSAAG